MASLAPLLPVAWCCLLLGGTTLPADVVAADASAPSCNEVILRPAIKRGGKNVRRAKVRRPDASTLTQEVWFRDGSRVVFTEGGCSHFAASFQFEFAGAEAALSAVQVMHQATTRLQRLHLTAEGARIRMQLQAALAAQALAADATFPVALGCEIGECTIAYRFEAARHIITLEHAYAM